MFILNRREIYKPLSGKWLPYLTISVVSTVDCRLWLTYLSLCTGCGWTVSLAENNISFDNQILPYFFILFFSTRFNINIVISLISKILNVLRSYIFSSSIPSRKVPNWQNALFLFRVINDHYVSLDLLSRSRRASGQRTFR